MQKMLIGFNAPTAGPLSAADNLTKIVVGAEAMGFDYATFSDHVVIPTAIAAEYPYSASGEFPSGTRGERLLPAPPPPPSSFGVVNLTISLCA